MEEHEIYERARKRVYAIKGFYINLIVFILGNAFLLSINLIYTPEYLWFYWSMGGWGIGIILHAFSVFGSGMFFGRDWEDKKIREMVEKERKTAVRRDTDSQE